MEEDKERQPNTREALKEFELEGADDHEMESESAELENLAEMLEGFEKSKQRLVKFMEQLAEARDDPVSMEKYRNELPASKFQQFYNSQDIISIIDSMIKKARNTRRHKKNWSKYDLVVMFWLIEKFNLLYSKKPPQYTEDDWCCISSLIPGKQSFACLFKWLNLKMNSKNHKEPWSPGQSEILMRLVIERKRKGEDQSKSHWSIVSHQLYMESREPKIYRTAKQCRERWSCTNPEIKKDLWSKKEDVELLKGYLTVGKKWAMISRELGARTENAVKNRFELLEKRISNKAKKEMPQLPIRSHIIRYIEQLQLSQLTSNPSHLQPRPRQPTHSSNQLPDQQKVSQPTGDLDRHQLPTSILPSPSDPSDPTSQPNEQTRKVTFCRMTDMMFSQLRKNLVPAVFENEQLTLHRQNMPVRIEGWIKFDAMHQHHSAFKSSSFL